MSNIKTSIVLIDAAAYLIFAIEKIRKKSM